MTKKPAETPTKIGTRPTKGRRDAKSTERQRPSLENVVKSPILKIPQVIDDSLDFDEDPNDPDWNNSLEVMKAQTKRLKEKIAELKRNKRDEDWQKDLMMRGLTLEDIFGPPEDPLENIKNRPYLRARLAAEAAKQKMLRSILEDWNDEDEEPLERDEG